jgi:sec-independent protein translocase protein TatA
MPDLGVWEILIIAVVILVLFGSKKLPDTARSMGRSLRIFKSETKGLRDDDDETPAAQQENKDQSAEQQKEQKEQKPQGQLPAAQKQDEAAPLNGVPVSDPEQVRRNN